MFPQRRGVFHTDTPGALAQADAQVNEILQQLDSAQPNEKLRQVLLTLNDEERQWKDRAQYYGIQGSARHSLLNPEDVPFGMLDEESLRDHEEMNAEERFEGASWLNGR